jgi:ATP synthase protein I
MNAFFRGFSKPVRTVIRWQAWATGLMVVGGAWLAGSHGALSAALGGLISVVSGLAAARLVAWRSAEPPVASAETQAARATEQAGRALLAALRAEGARIGLIVILLWLVMATYQAVIAPLFFGAFLVTVIIFSLAFFVGDENEND